MNKCFFAHLNRYRMWFLLALFLITLFCGAIFYIYQYVGTGHVIVQTPKELPGDAYTALLLGCTPNGTSFRARIAGMVELYQSGKIKKIIASGSRDGAYDEPSAMRDQLVAQGVPEEIIILDFGGLRTLDSVIRAQRFFHAETLLIVSQRYHVKRAMFQAKEHNIPATGYAVADTPYPSEKRRWIFREIFARLYAIGDTKILHTQPRYPGEVPLPESLASADREKAKN